MISDNEKSFERNTEPDYVRLPEILQSMVHERGGYLNSIYHSPDFPGIVLRSAGHTVREKEPIEKIRDDYTSYSQIAEAGCRVVPFSLVENAPDSFCIIAQRVLGEPLSRLLAERDDLRQTFDEITARQFTDIASLRTEPPGSTKKYPRDSLGSQQFMYGKLYGSNEDPGIIFVDIEQSGSPDLYFTPAEMQDDSSYLGVIEFFVYCIDQTRIIDKAELIKSKEVVNQLLTEFEQETLSEKFRAVAEKIRHRLADNEVDDWLYGEGE